VGVIVRIVVDVQLMTTSLLYCVQIMILNTVLYYTDKSRISNAHI